MLVQPGYAMRSMSEVRRTIAAGGWAILTTHGPAGLRAAHLPCLLDPEHDRGGDAEELVILGHIARADPQYLDGEVLLVFQGPHGYVSAAWYETDPFVPTWNYIAVHVTGVPELLDGREAFAVLERTVEHFEARRERPWRLEGVPREYAERIQGGVVAFRLRATRVEAKAKLSQDKAPEVRDRVIAALERPGPYRAPELADEMRRVN